MSIFPAVKILIIKYPGSRSVSNFEIIHFVIGVLEKEKKGYYQYNYKDYLKMFCFHLLLLISEGPAVIYEVV